VFNLLESDPKAFEQEAQRARASLQEDPHRPLYHFTAPYNWLNDPNGLIQWNGEYHLFYQHNPYSPLSATKHWGHAVSSDLVHWDDMPIALAPGPEDYDSGGIYSGTAVNDGGVPTIIYTGIEGPHQRVCIATGDDQLLSWEKINRNPVVSGPPPGIDVLKTQDGTVHYRDPSVWREDDSWWMVIGSGITGTGGTVLLYRSENLRDWEYIQPILVGDIEEWHPVWTGSMWECPQLFALDGQHVLLVSIWHERRTLYPAYMTGTFDGGRFAPKHVAILDAGSHYAPQTLRDDHGRRILFGWLREQRSEDAMAESGWNGAMSIPWILELAQDGSLKHSPAPELQSLRGNHVEHHSISIDEGQTLLFQDIAGDSLELKLELFPGDATSTGVVLRRSSSGDEETRVTVDLQNQRLWVNKRRSSMDVQADQTHHEMPLHLAADELLSLSVFLDRSIIEVLANGRVMLSERVYPTLPDSVGVGIFAEGASLEVASLQAWTMKGIWAE
jgi:beta-fructofuranosidase